MSASQIHLVVLGIIFLAAFALPLVALKWGLKRAGLAEISFLKAFGIFLLIFVGTSIVSLVVELLMLVLHVETSDLVSYSIGIVFNIVVASLVIAVIYKEGLRRAVRA